MNVRQDKDAKKQNELTRAIQTRGQGDTAENSQTQDMTSSVQKCLSFREICMTDLRMNFYYDEGIQRKLPSHSYAGETFSFFLNRIYSLFKLMQNRRCVFSRAHLSPSVGALPLDLLLASLIKGHSYGGCSSKGTISKKA